MRKKDAKCPVVKGDDHTHEFAEMQVNLPMTERKARLDLLTREERIQEASKSLYLKRYE